MSVHLVCYGLCDQRLSCSGRAVEQNTFRGFDAETLEEFRVPERELDHLPDELELTVEPSDILVVDIPDNLALPFLGLVRGLFQFDLGAVGDDVDAFRGHFGDDERERVAEDADPDLLPLGDRPAPQDSPQVLFPAHQADGLRRLDGHLFRVSGFGLPDPDFVVDPRPDVAPGVAVDAQDRLTGVLRESRPYERRRLLTALNLDDVAADETESLHGVHAQSSDPTAGILVSRFFDGYLNGFGIRHVNNLLFGWFTISKCYLVFIYSHCPTRVAPGKSLFL